MDRCNRRIHPMEWAVEHLHRTNGLVPKDNRRHGSIRRLQR